MVAAAGIPVLTELLLTHKRTNVCDIARFMNALVVIAHSPPSPDRMGDQSLSVCSPLGDGLWFTTTATNCGLQEVRRIVVCKKCDGSGVNISCQNERIPFQMGISFEGRSGVSIFSMKSIY
jgi:hypothetical protein